MSARWAAQSRVFARNWATSRVRAVVTMCVSYCYEKHEKQRPGYQDEEEIRQHTGETAPLDTTLAGHKSAVRDYRETTRAHGNCTGVQP